MMALDTDIKKTLVISVYKKYGVVGTIQGCSTIKPETKIKPFEQYHSAAQFEGVAQIK